MLGRWKLMFREAAGRWCDAYVRFFFFFSGNFSGGMLICFDWLQLPRCFCSPQVRRFPGRRTTLPLLPEPLLAGLAVNSRGHHSLFMLPPIAHLAAALSVFAALSVLAALSVH